MDVVVTIGEQNEVSSLGPQPPNVHVERWLPLALLLPRCTAAICHAGSGTTLAALGAGLPLLRRGRRRLGAGPGGGGGAVRWTAADLRRQGAVTDGRSRRQPQPGWDRVGAGVPLSRADGRLRRRSRGAAGSPRGDQTGRPPHQVDAQRRRRFANGPRRLDPVLGRRDSGRRRGSGGGQHLRARPRLHVAGHQPRPGVRRRNDRARQPDG